MAFGIGEIVSAVLLGKMGVQPILSEIQKRQQQFLQLLGQAQTNAALDLSQALEKLAASGMKKGIDSHQFFRNLEKLIPLLCLDACHHRVAKQVSATSAVLIERQMLAMRAGSGRISRGRAHALLTDMGRLLLWDPECAEVFEATKVDREQARCLPSESWLESWLPAEELKPVIKFKPTARDPSDTNDPHAVNPPYLFYADVYQAFADIFARAKETHKTQRKLADALSQHNGLLQSYNDKDALKAVSKWEEAERLRNKLLELSHLSHTNSDRFDTPATNWEIAKRAKRGTIPHIAVDRVSDGVVVDEDPILKQRVAVKFVYHEEVLTEHAVDRWKRAIFRLLLLIGRFEARAARIQRLEEIAALFDAVGATPKQRDQIQSCINSLYGAIYRCWEADDWIKILHLDTDKSQFDDRRFGGWKAPTSKRRRLFLQHYNSFQFISPRQLTENGVLAAVQTMESQEDAVFTRTSRLNRELQDIFDRVCENENHGKFDEAIADLNILLHRLSETSGPNAVDYPPEIVSAIHSYLAYCYAFRGEHLEKAVQSAKEAMRIQNTFLALLILGWCYQQQGKVPEAIEALEAAKEPTMQAGSALLPLLHRVLGDAYRDAEQHQQAEQEWQAGWERAEDPEWKAQDGLTAFERTKRAALRTELGERLGIQENDE